MGVTLHPLVDALKTEMLSHPVLHADETPVAMLDPGKGKTHRTYLWFYSITTLPTAGPANMPRNSSAPGAARSSATIMLATRR